MTLCSFPHKKKKKKRRTLKVEKNIFIGIQQIPVKQIILLIHFFQKTISASETKPIKLKMWEEYTKIRLMGCNSLLWEIIFQPI